MPRRPEVEAALLGLLHGPAELLPISSSAHAAALPWLLDWRVARWPPGRRKELQVALHAGTALALAADLIPPRQAWGVVALAAAPAGAAGLVGEEWVESKLGDPTTLPAGLLAGAAALVCADHAPGHRHGRMTARDAVWLGLAQALALAPGVSRTGATLAAARARGFSRPAASRLSFAVAGPVLLSATALKGARVAAALNETRVAAALEEGRVASTGSNVPPTRSRVGHALENACMPPTLEEALDAPAGATVALAAAMAASFVSARAARQLIGLERRRPLWPWAAERVALAVVILVVRYRRHR